MMDLGFPVIRYSRQDTPRQRGRGHGESFRDGIAELAAIRSGLLREKNTELTAGQVERLALEQWEATRAYDPTLFDELEGIREGAGVSVTDLVILNNYTDFRDIHVPDQGCSVVFVNYDRCPVAGQTWDMHGSAKRFVSCLEVPCDGFERPAVLFSLVGCLGMMGYHPAGHMVGINNINTDGARAGAIWPAVVRRILAQADHVAMDRELAAAPVTSGHAWLLASSGAGEFWEVMPGLAERIDRLETSGDGYLFHTNHCLGHEAKQRETVIGRNSTTYIRYDLLQRKIADVKTAPQVYRLLNDHENYPKSICSNFQTDSQDPSVTCGGAVGDLTTGQVTMWRGDELYDGNFVCHEFDLGGSRVA